MNELTDAAVEIARGAGAILADFYHGSFEVEHKGTVDLVTDADRAAEDFILRALARDFPGHAVLAEESGVARADGPYRWVIDPLDGTTNFAHRLPFFCVLIAVQERQPDGTYRTDFGVALDPLRRELFVAERGRGAFLNGERMRVSKTARLIDAVLATGFPVSRLFEPDRDNHREFCRLSLVTQAVRRYGSAGLDLAYVAAGRFDGFWEYNLNLWDVSPGALMVAEAGGRVTQSDGSPFDAEGRAVCVSNGLVHDALVEAIASARARPANDRDGLEAFLPPEVVEKIGRDR